jgi:hypothetical protein
MKYGFEKRQDSVNKLSKRATKEMLDDFANGKTQKYWQWLQKDPPLQWLLQNKGLAPQLAYERLAGAKEALLNAGGSTKSNINAFIKRLDKELDRLAKRDDVEADKEFFKSPMLPLPEQKEYISLDKDDSKEKHGDYGVHQKNRQWIVDTFAKQEQRPDLDSQNKVAQEVRSLYKEKFDLLIGVTTILRKAGKVA